MGYSENLREGFEMSGDFSGDSSNGKKWRETSVLVRTQNDSKSTDDMVSTEVSKFSGNADGFAESVHLSTGWMQLAQDRGKWQQFVKFGKSPTST